MKSPAPTTALSGFCAFRRAHEGRPGSRHHQRPRPRQRVPWPSNGTVAGALRRRIEVAGRQQGAVEVVEADELDGDRRGGLRLCIGAGGAEHRGRSRGDEREGERERAERHGACVLFVWTWCRLQRPRPRRRISAPRATKPPSSNEIVSGSGTGAVTKASRTAPPVASIGTPPKVTDCSRLPPIV